MSDLRQSFHERSKLWGSFKKRLSGPSIRRTSITGQKTPQDCEATGVARPVPPTRRTEKTPSQIQAERPTRRRSEGDRRPRETARTEIATKSTPVTCFPTRPNQNGAGGFSSLFFCTSVQKFAQLDDDTFSTRPNVGLAARYNQRDYSDVWLAEDCKSEEVEDKKYFSQPKSSTSGKKDAKKGSSRFNAKKKTLLIPSSSKKDNVLTPRNIGILEKEISRLTSALNKSIMVDRMSHPHKRDPHHFYDDYADKPTEIAATDTDVSTSTGSGFSFRADFSHLLVRETTRGGTSHEEECKREEEETPVSSTGAKVETPTQFVSSRGVLPLLDTEPIETEIAATTNVRASQEDKSKQRDLPITIAQDTVRVFQPILAESTHNDSIYEHDNPAWGVRDLLETSVRYNNTNNSAAVPGAKQKAQSIFRTYRQVAGKNWHKHYYEKQTFDERDHDSILRHIDESCVGEATGDDNIGIQEICLSQDDSHLMSEMTDTFSTGGLLRDENETSYDGYFNDGNNTQRKAKCVVFHNQQLFNESDHRLIKSNVPVKVKEVISKFEALKRMEVDHPDKYFLPIDETHEAAYASYEETAKEHFNAEGINWAGSESFSLE